MTAEGRETDEEAAVTTGRGVLAATRGTGRRWVGEAAIVLVHRAGPPRLLPESCRKNPYRLLRLLESHLWDVDGRLPGTRAMSQSHGSSEGVPETSAACARTARAALFGLQPSCQTFGFLSRPDASLPRRRSRKGGFSFPSRVPPRGQAEVLVGSSAPLRPGRAPRACLWPGKSRSAPGRPDYQ